MLHGCLANQGTSLPPPCSKALIGYEYPKQCLIDSDYYKATEIYILQNEMKCVYFYRFNQLGSKIFSFHLACLGSQILPGPSGLVPVGPIACSKRIFKGLAFVKLLLRMLHYMKLSLIEYNVLIFTKVYWNNKIQDCTLFECYELTSLSILG